MHSVFDLGPESRIENVNATVSICPEDKIGVHSHDRDNYEGVFPVIVFVDDGEYYAECPEWSGMGAVGDSMNEVLIDLCDKIVPGAVLIRATRGFPYPDSVSMVEDDGAFSIIRLKVCITGILADMKI